MNKLKKALPYIIIVIVTAAVAALTYPSKAKREICFNGSTFDSFLTEAEFKEQYPQFDSLVNGQWVWFREGSLVAAQFVGDELQYLIATVTMDSMNAPSAIADVADDFPCIDYTLGEKNYIPQGNYMFYVPGDSLSEEEELFIQEGGIPLKNHYSWSGNRTETVLKSITLRRMK